MYLYISWSSKSWFLLGCFSNLNRRIKERSPRSRIDSEPTAKQFKPGSFADPIRKLNQFGKEEVFKIVKYAIEAHNNTQNRYNKNRCAPLDFDKALHDSKALVTGVISAPNNDLQNALVVQDYRD